MRLSVDDLFILGFALLSVICLVALPLAILVAVTLLRRFRGRVARSMRIAAGVPALPQSNQSPIGRPTGELTIELIEATRQRANEARAVPLLATIRQHKWRLTFTYAAATCSLPLVIAAVYFAEIPTSSPWTLVQIGLFFCIFFLQFATPVMLASTLILGKQVHWLLLGTLALIAAMWGQDALIGVDSIGLWLMASSVPTGAVLLLNIRRLRAVGPIVFAALLLALFGTVAGVIYAAIYALDKIGPIRFIREDLVQLPLSDATRIYFGELRNLPAAEMVAAVRAFAANPLSVIQVDNADALTTEVLIYHFGIVLAVTVVGCAAAWALVRWIAWSYRSQRASDQMLAIDVLMVIFTWSGFVALTSYGWSAVWVLAGFVGYKLIFALRSRRQPALTPRTLLLLRVFGFARRTQQLLDDLGQRWRYIGPIQLIGGPDLADSTIEPHEFLEFLNGRLTRSFIANRSRLESRLSASPTRPDPDGLFRIDDFFCHDDTWRLTVTQLARAADAVVMDLRGFTSANWGCIFEIEHLAVAVPLQRVVLLVNDSTDIPFLKQVLRRAWSTPHVSPNAAVGGNSLRILQASSGHRTLDVLLGLLCEDFDQGNALYAAVSNAG